MKSADKWSDGQKERAKILFNLYPDIQKAYSLSHSLRVIFNNKNATPESARMSLKGWYDKVKTFKNEDLHTLAETIQSREDDVLNFFLFRSTNASAEALNTKIKAFRAQLRCIGSEVLPLQAHQNLCLMHWDLQSDTTEKSQ